MKNLKIYIIALVIVSCSNVESVEQVEQVQLENQLVTNVRSQGENIRGKIQVVEIEGCEYIIWDWMDTGNIVHKHNCKYCEARLK